MAQTPRTYSVEEAEEVLAGVRPLVSELGRIRTEIAREEAAHDAEEVASHGLTGRRAGEARSKMDGCRRRIRSLEDGLEKRLSVLKESGIELRSLSPVRVDFGAVYSGKNAYWCWQEAESAIGFWHAADEGCGRRRPLNTRGG